MKWNKEELEKAINLLKDGSSYVEIGLELNRSRKSVKEKLNDLGFSRTSYIDNKKYHIQKKCLQCEKQFDSLITDERKFCTSSCSATFNNSRKEKKVSASNKRTEPEKRNNKKDIYTITCLHCGNESNNRRKEGKYCSQECHRLDKKKIVYNKIESGDITVSNRHYKLYLIEKHGEKCMDCGWCERNIYSDTIPIELEHVDGNASNNALNNLKLLCPSCHSLTPTYRALNTGNGRYKRRERYQEGKSF